MIVVRVELHSAKTGRISELARMTVCNEGGSETRGTYRVQTYRGRSRDALDRRAIARTGWVVDYPRLSLHVWNLVMRALASVGYRAARP